MIKPYEAMFILRADLAEEPLKKLVAQIEEAIVKVGGKVEISQPWGRRRLAFPIGKQKEGVYHLVDFTCPSLAIDPLRQVYRLNEQIMRTMILSIESIPAPAPVTAAPVAATASVGIPTEG